MKTIDTKRGSKVDTENTTLFNYNQNRYKSKSKIGKQKDSSE